MKLVAVRVSDEQYEALSSRGKVSPQIREAIDTWLGVRRPPMTEERAYEALQWFAQISRRFSGVVDHNPVTGEFSIRRLPDTPEPPATPTQPQHSKAWLKKHPAR